MQLVTAEHRSFLTDEIKALIGTETEWGPYSEPISPSEVRRFVHAIMDDNPIYYDESYAAGTKYGGVICPPLYASFAFRRQHGHPDPLDRLKTDREWDALGGGANNPRQLPPVPHGFPRMVNGGAEVELHKRVKPGKRVRTKSRYCDIRERVGSTGAMCLIVTETLYQDDDGDLLASVRQTSIYR